MLARRTLLLADDSPTVQKVVSLTFSDEGVRVLTAGGGGEALAQLEQTVPDIVLADVHMPAPGGYELCARIKRDARLAQVPVVLLVGAFEPFDEAEARKSGADGVLTKPFQSIRELVNKVGGLLGGHPDAKSVGAGEGARAREPEADTTAARAVAFPQTTAAAPHDSQAASLFEGFDSDDESIESVSADDYVALGRARSAGAGLEFSPAEEPFPAGVARGGEAFAFGGAEQPRPREERGYATAATAASKAAANFESRAARRPAEDSLLELDDFESPQARASADADDFILDIEDDTVVSSSADAPDAGGVEISPVNLSSAWSESARFEVSPEAGAGPVAVETPEVEFDFEDGGQSFEIEAEALASETAEPTFEARAGETRAEWFEGGATPAASADVAVESGPEAFGDVNIRESAHEAGAGESRPAAQAGAAQLSPESVDAIARRVVELMSDRAVREIAWEVVPELAERVIRERLEEEKARAQ